MKSNNLKIQSKRRKLWQVNSAYHCSIIGSCMSRADLRSFAAKRDFEMNQNDDAYTIHNRLTYEAAGRAKFGRALHSFLDKKHFVAIKRYSVLTDPKAIEEQWHTDIEEGDAAGAYWAIMTHPCSTTSLQNSIYGECHMLSFDSFSSARQENKTLSTLRNSNKNLQAQLRSEKLKGQAQQQQLNEYKLKIQELENITKQINKTINSHVPLSEDGLDAHNSLKQENKILLEKLKRMQKTHLTSQEQAVLLLKDQENLQANLTQLTNREKQYKDEIASLETIVEQQLGLKLNCSTCEDHLTPACKGPDLCGQRVLYVGGQHKMIAHYRKLIEKQGGIFLHHDGGKEDSRQQLPKVLCSADAVVCPVDCVSHDACKKVKKICKQYSKPFVMMRSSGLSSLAKSLNEIQNDDYCNIM